jgi:peptidoglycan hydrolase-like protein with peptidoglycan-binding domain
LANQDYVISFDGGERSGTTDDGGVLREGLPEAIEEATLSVAGQTLTLLLDTLDPLEDESGVEAAQARLQNLGYELGNVDGDLAEKTRGALETFQADQGIGVTGVLDGPTRERLTLAHGC